MSDLGHEVGADADSSAPNPFERSDPPLFSLTLWPHRSLSQRGFAWVIGLVTVGLALPLLGLLGSMAAWGILPFLMIVPVSLYFAFKRSYLDGRLTEELRLWPDLITVERREPRGRVCRWHANPFWVQVQLFDNARIEKYLTLRGNGREIELGAFLSPHERETLYRELGKALGIVRNKDAGQPA